MTPETKIIVDAIDRLTDEVRQLRISLFPEPRTEAPWPRPAEITDTSFSQPIEMNDVVLGG